LAGYHVRRQFGGIIKEIRVFNREYPTTLAIETPWPSAAFVRFNALKILFTPALEFAIVFQRANVSGSTTA
jgi:hypothetical protein